MIKRFIQKQKEYIKWLFRKPQISFNRKPSEKEVIKLIKEQNLYELSKLLPQFKFGKKRLTRFQSLLLLGTGIGVGVLSSILLDNPYIFLIGLGITYGTVYEFSPRKTDFISVSALDSTHFVIAYRDLGASSHGKAIIGTVSNGDDITYGSIYEFDATATTFISVSALDSTHFVIAYSDSTTNGKSIIGVVSNGDDIAYGSEYQFNARETNEISVASLDSTHFVIAFKDEGGSDYGKAIIGVVSNGDDIAFGSIYDFNSGNSLYISAAKLDSTHFVVAFKNSTTHGQSIVGTVSNGDDITFGSIYEFNGVDTTYISAAALDATHFVVAFMDDAASDHGQAIIGTVSNGDDITYGTKYEFINKATIYISVSKIDSTNFVICFTNNEASNVGQSIIGTVSNGDDIAYGTVYDFSTEIGAAGYNSVATLDSTHFVIGFSEISSPYHGQAIIGVLPTPVSPTNASFLYLMV